MKGRIKKKTSLSESARKVLKKRMDKRDAILSLPQAVLQTPAPVALPISPLGILQTPPALTQEHLTAHKISTTNVHDYQTVLGTPPATPQSVQNPVFTPVSQPTMSQPTISPVLDEQQTRERSVEGKKRPREEDIIQQMLDIMRQGNEREERMRRELEEQRSLIVAISKSQCGDDESISSGRTLVGSDDLTNILVRERAVLECSRGQYKAGALEGVELPPSWPLYAWPKSWHVAKRQQMARALIALKDLQEQHVDLVKRKSDEGISQEELMKKALSSALGELKSHLRTLGRGLRYGEWEIIQPIVTEASTLDYPHHHRGWEICIKGLKEYPVFITDHLLACRSVSPMIMSSASEWDEVVSGGEWPTASTKGWKTGLPKTARSSTLYKPSATDASSRMVAQNKNNLTKKSNL